MCPDKERPAGNTCRIAKGLDAVWALLCPPKPCLLLSTDGSVPQEVLSVNREKVKTKLQKFIKNSSKKRDAFLENGFCGPEAQYFTGIVIDPVFDLLDRFRCDFPEVCSFREPTADHSIHIFV